MLDNTRTVNVGEGEDVAPTLVATPWQPAPLTVPQGYPAPAVTPEKPKNDLSDMFAVPQPGDNDIATDDLFEAPNMELEMEDDLSDLTRVTNEDIMGRPPKPRQKPVQRYMRTNKPLPPSLGGMRQ